MRAHCADCSRLDRNRQQPVRHHGLVETTLQGNGPQARSFMCLGCGARWRWDASSGWSPSPAAA